MIKPEIQVQLITLYNQPDRHYHNFSHINHCLGEFEKYKDSRPSSIFIEKEIEYAIWFHDVIYNPHSSKNELNSVNYLIDIDWTIFNDKPDLATVAALILGTKDHSVSSESIEEAHNILNDIDYSILGQPIHVYLEYMKNIRKEYWFVEPEKYYFLRKKFLSELLKTDKIYKIKYFHDKYENKARKNIEKEIEML